MSSPSTRFEALVRCFVLAPLLVVLVANPSQSVGAQALPTESEPVAPAGPTAQVSSPDTAMLCRGQTTGAGEGIMPADTEHGSGEPLDDTGQPALRPGEANRDAGPRAQGYGGVGAATCPPTGSLPLPEDATDPGTRSVPRGSELSPEELQRIKTGQGGDAPPFVQPQQEDPSE